MVKQVDAFTTRPFCGNPAGVITEADGLTTENMQRIAGEMNLSETSFITIPESEGSTFRIRFFTPSEEVDVSGHVMIACCFALAEEGRIILGDGMTKIYFETNIGNLPLDIYFRKGRPRGADIDGVPLTGVNNGVLERIMVHQKIERFQHADIPLNEIATILGIDTNEILKTGLPLEIISTGLNQLMVPVHHKETLLGMHPDLIKLSLLNRRFGVHTNHIFTLDTVSPDCVTYSRHFAPSVGMWEDPATGTASAGLGTYLLRHGVITTGSMVMEQGNEIDNLARILVEIDQTEEETPAVLVGGLAITSISREIVIEAGKKDGAIEVS
jgi:PhzF family phenazine biosynthesis protein